jgi:hypothetical protein
MTLDANRLSNSESLILLARIAHELTVCARGTYEAGTTNVLEPSVLRAFNELQHRVTGSLRDHLLGTEGIPVDTLLKMMREFGVRHNRTAEINWALEQAYQRNLAKW